MNGVKTGLVFLLPGGASAAAAADVTHILEDENVKLSRCFSLTVFPRRGSASSTGRSWIRGRRRAEPWGGLRSGTKLTERNQEAVAFKLYWSGTNTSLTFNPRSRSRKDCGDLSRSVQKLKAWISLGWRCFFDQSADSGVEYPQSFTPNSSATFTLKALMLSSSR